MYFMKKITQSNRFESCLNQLRFWITTIQNSLHFDLENHFKNQNVIFKAVMIFALLNSNYFYSKENFRMDNNSLEKTISTVSPTTNGNLTMTASGSFTWAGPYGSGLTYTSSGVYTHITTNELGFPNTATLNLTITVNSFIIGTASCGRTISNLSVTISTPVVPGTPIYKFRVKNLITNAIIIIDRPTNNFSLINYISNGILLGTPYEIEVSTDGGATYGPPCALNTPAPFSNIGAQCGTTLTSMSQNIFCTFPPNVTSFRFRVTNTVTNQVQILTRISPNFNFNQLASRSCGTKYFVEVALRNTDNVTYLPYSTGCEINTQSITTTGSENIAICSGQTYTWPANGITYSTAQTGVTVTTGCNIATLNLTIIPHPAAPTGLACYETANFNTTSCAWEVTGTQPAAPTGLACYETASFNTTTCQWDVTGTQPTLGSLTVTAVGSYIWSGPYGNGITYTTSGVYTSTVGCNIATLNLTITVNTFTVGVSCGSTITNLAVTIVTPYVIGVNTYIFRLTNMVTNVVQTVSRPVNSIALSNTYFTGITYNTPYQIEVSINGGLSFGPPCIVNTPTPISAIEGCGTTLTSMSQYVYCTFATGVTGYRFRITNTSTNAVHIVNSGLNRFNFNQVPLPIRSFATTYIVEVALSNTDGSYFPYTEGCTITTMPFPTTRIRPLQCGLPSTSYTAQLEAVIVSGASEYRFRLTNVAQPYSATVTKFINKVTLAEFAGLLPGTTYIVEVALKIDGNFGPYGSPCNVTTPGAGKAAPVVSNEFKVVAYPNPFAGDFMLNVKTSSESAVQIRVYDMLGKQMDNRNVEVSAIENLQVGSNYPSGVYNVIVSQGENNQTLRVIKR